MITSPSLRDYFGPADARAAVSQYLQQLGMFSAARGTLDVEVLTNLNNVFRPTHGDMRDPICLRRLLEDVGFVKPGDNIHRLLTKSKLQLPDTVHAYVDRHVDPADPFDSLRSQTTSNIYAIDSVTTSEVDDAIGLEVSPAGHEVVTVYVADATAFVPFDSDLEALSGRQSGTTVYLPEGVFFMLPKKIVAAATLEANRKCRTFEIRFQVDDEGNVKDYDVAVGWTEHLKRLSYEQAQEVLDAGGKAPTSSLPSWTHTRDIEKLLRLQKIAHRLTTRRQAVTANLPDPYIRVDPKEMKVTELHDQQSDCADAYAFVAAFMIAANEVCSRVAQQNELPIPFRGSRPLSTVHEAAKQYHAPGGMVPVGSKESVSSDSGKFAVSLLQGLDALRGVSRALYHHRPLWHNGLETRHYCHSTSPLRRYPDMLVHHQLKSWIARRNGRNLLVPIEEFQMAELCQSSSSTQLSAAHMQTNSQRYWSLKYLADQQASQGALRLDAVVGFTHDVSACPDTSRELSRAFRYRSDVFIPSIQTLEVVYHNDSSVEVGSELHCAIQALEPTTSRLVLRHLQTKKKRQDIVERLAKATRVGE